MIRTRLGILVLLLTGVFLLLAVGWQGQDTSAFSRSDGALLKLDSAQAPHVNRSGGPSIIATASGEVCGDLNESGEVDVFDAIEILQIIVDLEDQTLSKAILADLTKDGKISVPDAILPFQHIAGLITITDCGPPPPTVSDFSPKSGSVGTLASVTGSRFVFASRFGPQVTINKQGGGTMSAPVASFDGTSLLFVIPPGAQSGPVTVTVAEQSVSSSDLLTIVPSSDFSVIAEPSAADVIQGQLVSYTVTLSSDSGFSQLATLDVFGLPEGVAAFFQPEGITAEQTSLLTIIASEDQSPGTASLTVTATANVDGMELVESVDLTLNVQPVTTSFLGRTVVDDAIQTAIAGVTITLLGQDGDGNVTGCSGQTVSDAAGNFSFTGLPIECTGPQLIRYDGTTATSPPGDYAGVDLLYDIVPDQVTVSPVLIHLPRIDNAETVMVTQDASEDQNFTFETIPNLSVTVYSGTIFTLVDGSQPDPFPLTAIQVPVDRLPEEMPPSDDTVEPFIVAFQPANATASQPMAVFFPNLINTAPGINMPLSTLDPTKGVMVVYGTGTVSVDGTQIIPDFDPATPGRRFGLVHFDWHGPRVPPKGKGGCGCTGGPSPGPAGQGGGPFAGKPVNILWGEETITERDIGIDGPRGAIEIVRSYRHLLTLNGPFGIGTSHNYGDLLDAGSQRGGVINLVFPDASRSPFSLQPDGTYRNFSIPSLHGVVLGAISGSRMEIR